MTKDERALAEHVYKALRKQADWLEDVADREDLAVQMRRIADKASSWVVLAKPVALQHGRKP